MSVHQFKRNNRFRDLDPRREGRVVQVVSQATRDDVLGYIIRTDANPLNPDAVNTRKYFIAETSLADETKFEKIG